VKAVRCDNCGTFWSPECYATVEVKAPGGPVVHTFDFCKKCMAKGVLIVEKKDTPVTPASGGPPNAQLN
jgi:hypothetical protein